MLNPCTLGGSQRAICPGLRHTAYTTSSYMPENLGILCVVRHARSALSLMSLHNWNVHDIAQEPDMCEASAPSEV